MRLTLPLFCSLLTLSCATTSVPPVVMLPPSPSQTLAPPISWADSVLATMTLEEKAAQMIMVGTYGHYFSAQSEQFERLLRLVQVRKVGGFILWQSDVYEAAVRLNTLQRLSRIPLLMSGDFETGLAMRVRRGTAFPDAMALGATRNPLYAYEVGKAIAEEARAIGVHQNYAPVADINTNPANPVINTRSYGEDPLLVRSMVTAFVRGTQAGGAVATVKHFPGHGATEIDSHLDLPVLPFARARFDTVELVPFQAAIDSGVHSVMIAHIAVPAFDPGSLVPASLSRNAIEGVLQTEMGFGGLVVTDAMDMRGVSRDYSVAQSTVLAVKAGVDIVLMPPDEESALDALVSAVRTGEIPRERVERSVRKILQAKQRLGLDTARIVDLDNIATRVATRDHLSLAREVARNAITVLRNTGDILPLQLNERKRILSVIVTDEEDYRVNINRPTNPRACEQVGKYFNSLIQQRNGRIETITLSPATDSLEIDQVLKKIRRVDLVVMPVFARVRSSSGTIGLPETLQRFAARVEALRVPTVVLAFGTPYMITAFPRADALLCAYGDSEPLMEAAAEALFGEIGACGKLPVNVPGLYPNGSGLVCTRARLRRDEPSEVGFDNVKLHRVEDIVREAISDSAFPAAQIVVGKDGSIVLQKSFGRYTYGPLAREIENGTLFDLASVSKVIGTTSAVMKLIDQKRLSLDDTLGTVLPEAGRGVKGGITIRQLLLHRAGFPPFKRFFLMCRSAEEALDSIYACDLLAATGDTTIYSDIGMITLGKVVEKITGMSLADFLQREIFAPLGMKSTMYNPPLNLRERVAPTEIDTLWRKQLVQGQVHDENAALLGGVAGHAGLFSTASDLAIYVQMLLNKGVYGGVRLLQESTVIEFTRNFVPGQNRYLGWDMKSLTGSSAGSLFSPSSFGHTGFTGTSIWIDPTRNLFVILLTNRVHPTRANLKIAKVRPAVHDAVINALLETSAP